MSHSLHAPARNLFDLFYFKTLFCICIVLASFLAVSCDGGVLPDPRFGREGDYSPPSILEYGRKDDGIVFIDFDEDAREVDSGLWLTGDLRISAESWEGRRLEVEVGGDERPDTCYILEGVVEDAAGNHMAFRIPFWGRNAAPCDLRISEALTQGSSTHPDFVEFKVLTGGSLGGVCLSDGSPLANTWRFVFPSVDVVAGEYVVLFMKEPDAATLSALPPGTRRWTHPDLPGLSGSNGSLCLRASPDGRVMDCLLYSDRSSSTDDGYGGFGSKALYQAATELGRAGAWDFKGESAPEACANSAGATSTRSIGRKPGSADTDTAADWMVCASKGASPGRPNSEAALAPAAAKKRKKRVRRWPLMRQSMKKPPEGAAP